MFTRRDFLKSSGAVCGSVGLPGPAQVFAGISKPSGYFGVHPFVDQHPEAVFIVRTHVDYKTNSEACKRVGLDLGRSLFVPMDNTGIPVTHDIATKPNLTAHQAVGELGKFSMPVVEFTAVLEGRYARTPDARAPGPAPPAGAPPRPR